jgi:HepT-like protein
VIPAYVVLAQRIRAEIGELERSVHRAERAWQAAEQAQADHDMFIDSAALNLHSFYAGLERLFEYTADQLDGGPPKGEAWHRELLRQISTELPGIRPPMITPDSATALDEFRRFRHVVRNVYAEHLDPARLGNLIAKVPGVWGRLKSELLAFADFLEGVDQLDETSA